MAPEYTDCVSSPAALTLVDSELGFIVRKNARTVGREHMEKKQQKRVVIFTTSTCSWCRRAKQYLKENKVRFREVDVGRNPSAAKDLVRVSGQRGVPVLLINNRPIVGFDKQQIDRLLGLR